jgi:anti-anti-sigma regulatory factor
MDEMTTERWQDPETPGKLELKLSGSLTIGQAAGFKEALLAALEAASGLLLDLSGVRESDLTGLQLLCAAHQSALAGGKRFTIKYGADPVYHEVVRNAGFRRQVGCSGDDSGSCIWLGGEC